MMAKSFTSHSSFHKLTSLAKKIARIEDCNDAKRLIMMFIENGAGYILCTNPYKTISVTYNEDLCMMSNKIISG